MPVANDEHRRVIKDIAASTEKALRDLNFPCAICGETFGQHDLAMLTVCFQGIATALANVEAAALAQGHNEERYRLRSALEDRIVNLFARFDSESDKAVWWDDVNALTALEVNVSYEVTLLRQANDALIQSNQDMLTNLRTIEAAAEAQGIERAVEAICANCIKHRPLQQVDKHWFHLVPTKAGTHFEECAGSVARALQPDPSHSVRLVAGERERARTICIMAIKNLLTHAQVGGLRKVIIAALESVDLAAAIDDDKERGE